MLEWLAALPFGYAMAALFAVVMLRANGTYWLGRGAAAGWRRSKWDGKVPSPAMARARDLISRWGAIAVALSFLTIGIQTAVNATAGVVRMPLKRYLPAVVLGSLIWAFMYATVGLAAVNAWLVAEAGSPRNWLFVVALAVVIGMTVLVRWLLTRAVRHLEPLDEQGLR